VDEESFKVQLSREQCSLECSEVVAVGIAELSNFHTRGYETKEGDRKNGNNRRRRKKRTGRKTKEGEIYSKSSAFFFLFFFSNVFVMR
jgi:hypothetical protein